MASTRTQSAELKADEQELRSKYKGIVAGSLREPSGRGKYAKKRTVRLKCKCGHEFESATSDVFIRCCPKCSNRINPAKKSRKAK